MELKDVIRHICDAVKKIKPFFGRVSVGVSLEEKHTKKNNRKCIDNSTQHCRMANEGTSKDFVTFSNKHNTSSISFSLQQPWKTKAYANDPPPNNLTPIQVGFCLPLSFIPTAIPPPLALFAMGRCH